MSIRRILLVARNECAFIFRCVNYYLLLSVVLSIPLVLWYAEINVLSKGRGDGGLWHNSQFAVTYQLALLGVFSYGLGLLDLIAKSWLRDGEDKISELLFSTPLTVREYIFGKYGGILASSLFAVFVHLGVSVGLQILPSSSTDAWGEFSFLNYIRPFLLILVPSLCAICSFLLCLAVWFNSMAGVQLMGFLAFSFSVFIAFYDSPTLSPLASGLFMLIDPSSLRWWNEAYVKIDQGVTFYNRAAIPIDTWFIANRLFMFLASASFLEFSIRWITDSRVVGKAARPQMTGDENIKLVSVPIDSSLARGIKVRPRSEFRLFFRMLAYELSAVLKNRLFMVMLFIYALGALLPLFFLKGQFGEPIRLTSGRAIGAWFSVLMMYALITLVFTLIETLFSDERHRLAPLILSEPVPTSALILSKSAACFFLSLGLVCLVFAGSLGLQFQRGSAVVDFLPYLIALVLYLPTLMFGAGLVSLIAALTNNRQWTYVIIVVFFMVLGQMQFTGSLTWVGNLMLTGVWQWSDMAGLEPWRIPLALNRCLYLSLSICLFFLSIQVFLRRTRDVSSTGFFALFPLTRGQWSVQFVLCIWPLFLALGLYHLMNKGPEGPAMEKWVKDYYLKNVETWHLAPVPTLDHVETHLVVEPENRGFVNRWTGTLVNREEKPIRRFPVTLAPNLKASNWTLDSSTINPAFEDGVYNVDLGKELASGERVKLTIIYSASFHRYPAKSATLGPVPRFVLEGGSYLNTGNTVEVFPIIGFIPLMEGVAPRRFHDQYWSGRNSTIYLPEPFTVRATVQAPEEYSIVGPGRLVDERVSFGTREVTYVSTIPVKGIPILVGRYNVRKSLGNEVYYHPEHEYNVEQILSDMTDSREVYSSWFGDYPFENLRLAEFPGFSTYAESFSSVIGYSERMGFLTDDGDLDLMTMITVHEVAHQWWGMLVTPADGPSLPILTESLAHYSALSFFEEKMGLKSRIELSRYFERRYLANRSVSKEQPLFDLPVGNSAHLAAVRYDKGGFSFFALSNALGHPVFRGILRRYVELYRDNPDHPTLHDFFEIVRLRTPDSLKPRIDEFVRQVFGRVVLPSFRLNGVKVERFADRLFRTTLVVSNVGTGHLPLDISVHRGLRFLRADRLHFEELRTEAWFDGGDTRQIEVVTSFEPDYVTLDPDALVLMANRQDSPYKLPPPDYSPGSGGSSSEKSHSAAGEP